MKDNEFPLEGLVRAKQAASFLGIGLSTFWRFVSDECQQIEKPKRFGSRISAWDAQYIRSLKENGLPEPVESR